MPAVWRVKVDYTFPEPFGPAEVWYCFEVGRLVYLESGYVVSVEQLQPGMRFVLVNDAIATVVATEPPEFYPPPDPEPNEDGNYARRVLGRIKHIGFAMMDLVVGSLTAETTPGHRFYSIDRDNWFRAIDLEVGEILKDGRVCDAVCY